MKQNVDTLGHLTPLQHGMLHHGLREPGTGLYIEQFSCRLDGALDVPRFRAAWQAVVQRHDVLKTLFIRLREERPVQVVRRQVVLPFFQDDWRALAPPVQQHRFEVLLHEDRARGFDLSVAPLMRVQLLVLGTNQHRFLWTYHHAILDGWSMPLLLEEVFHHYAGAPALPAPPRDFRHYLGWLRQRDAAADRAFWASHLAGFRTPVRFTKAVAPEEPMPGPRRLARESGTLTPEWAGAAAGWCRQERITLSTLCQGAWVALLALYGNTDDVVHGMVVSGRSADVAGIERMVGLFINTLPVRVRLDAALALPDWLRSLQSATMAVERHAHGALADVLPFADVPRTESLFESIYVFENYPGQGAFQAMVANQGLAATDLQAVEETNYPLALVVLPNDGLQYTLTYDRAAWSATAAARLLAQYGALLARIVADPGASVGDLCLDAAPPSAPTPPPAASSGLWACLQAQADLHPLRQACVTPTWQLDRQTLVRCIRGALRFWADRGYLPGDRVLLCGSDDAASLVLLLSGLAHGIDCVWPDLDTDLAALLAAGPAAWGAAGLAGCVTTGRGEAIRACRPGLRCDIADPMAVLAGGAGVDGMGSLSGPAGTGACSLLWQEPDGSWSGLRHDLPQLMAAIRWFADSLPVKQALDVALAAPPLAHASLWTTLLALGAGLVPRQLERVDGDDVVSRVVASGRHWHSVRLGPAETRRLGACLPAKGVRVDHWWLDAASATGRALKVIPGGSVWRTLAWPGRALPQAAWPPSTPPDALSAGTPGTLLSVVDRHLHPAGLDTRGCLVVGGAMVPRAWWQRGLPSPSWWQGAAGPFVLTGIEAWRGQRGGGLVLPHAGSAVDSPARRWNGLEARCAARPGVASLAVVEQLASGGDWVPHLYYTVAGGAAADTVAADLQATCADDAADALVPAVQLIQVVRLPASGGVVDRHALLRGEVTRVRRAGHVAPRDSTEVTLHEIWCGLLKRERIGVDEDYFDLGGQSLLAAVMLYQIEEQLGVSVDMDALLEAPTIAGLARTLREGEAATSRRIDFSREAALAADIMPATAWQRSDVRDVFLTGATGFLGVHLLADLLCVAPVRVHCLVRADSKAAGHRRLVEALVTNGLWHDDLATRIVAVPGELGEPLLGLGQDRFDTLARTVDTIYHNGAMVNFVFPYRSLKAVNVSATADVLRLACQHHAKPVHHVSTVGVLDRTASALPELLDVPLHGNLVGGYEQSKWVAEQLVVEAGRRGLPVTVYRPSRIVGHSRTGRMNTDDLFCRLIKGIVVSGVAPVGLGFDNVLPVDLASRLIVDCSREQEAVAGHAVHIVNPQPNSLDDVVDFVEAQGHRVERLDYDRWLERLAVDARRDTAHPLAMLLPVLRKLNPAADPSFSRPMPLGHVNLRRWASAALGEGLRPVSVWWQVVFDRFHATGYLPPVPARIAEKASA